MTRVECPNCGSLKEKNTNLILMPCFACGKYEEVIISEEEFEYLTDGGEEGDIVKVIKDNLRTPEQKQGLFDRDLSIENVLNGRYRSDDGFVGGMLQDWNARLGQKVFFIP